MRQLLITTVLLFIHTVTFSQNFTIRGTIIDGAFDEPMIGANVIEMHTTNGTVTDFDGKFTISVKLLPVVLEFSYIGYKTIIKKIETDSIPLILTLKESSKELQEVVKCGYSRVRKRDVSSSVTTLYPSVAIRGISSISSTSTRSVSKTKSKKHSVHKKEVAVKSRLLTAGEVNDFRKWNMWNDIAKGDLKLYQNLWQTYPEERYMVMVKTTKDLPVIDAEVQLLDRENNPLWSTRTDNTGKAEMWLSAFSENMINESLNITIKTKTNTYKLRDVKPFHNGMNVLEIKEEFVVGNAVDIAFVVDATGSMGDEISYLKAELKDIITKVRDSLPEREINTGAVFYKDLSDDYITRVCNFSDNIDDVIQFMNENNAGGGGDFPEAVDDALEQAVHGLSWSDNAISRIIFLVLDAPPHSQEKNRARIQSAITYAAQNGIRIVPLTCSGIGKSTEYLMRSIALLTNGTYSFLTDDSGIGNAHIKPTTDDYEVELMNDLIQRIIYQYTYVPKVNDEIETLKNDTITVSIKTVEPDTVKNNTVLKPKNQEKSWKYYPNPTNGIVHIYAEGGIDHLYICDISGHIVERFSLDHESSLTIDISQYTNGIYYLYYEYEPDLWKKGKLIKL